jgi:hypothetical protein
MWFANIIFGRFLEEGEIIRAAFRKRTCLVRVLAWFTFGVCAIYGAHWYNPKYIMVGFIGAGFCSLKMLQEYLWWYSNSVLMTSDSLVFVEWNKLFAPIVFRQDYWDLDSVEVIQQGLFALMAGFGDLHFYKISRAGNKHVFTQAEHPHKVVKKVQAFKEEMLNQKNFTEQSALKDLLANMVESHVRFNGQPNRPEHHGALLDPAFIPPVRPQPVTPPERHHQTPTQTHHTPTHYVPTPIIRKPVEQLDDHKHINHRMDDDGGVKIEL